MSIYEYDEEKHMKQVFEEGEKLGEERGQKLGEERGQKLGVKQGENRMSELIEILLKENRQDDLLRIAKDQEYRQELCRKYNL